MLLPQPGPDRTIRRVVQRWGFTWNGWRTNSHGEWWLLAQLLLILAHGLPALPAPALLGVHWPLGLRLLGAGMLMFGLVQAGRSALALGPSLTPLPQPLPDTPLVSDGPYRHCRHPLYQAVLLCSLGVVLLQGSLLHLALMLALAAVLARKAHLEERHLSRLHPDYDAYRRQSCAIVPGLPGLDWRDRGWHW
ncbi:MAG: methyltransferase family protein [Cyanobacteriota bacterium]|jgi:protein-S-isoprenylcysteine O-methyltransferase Ste14